MANAAERLTDVLTQLAASPGGLSAVEVGDCLGISRAASSRLLSLMVHARLVERDARTQRYYLGLDLWILASNTLSRFHILDLSLVPMAETVKKLRTPLLLGVNRGTDTYFLRKVELVLDSVLVTSIALKTPIGESAIGKAIAAYDASTRRGQDGLSADLKDIRSSGCSVRRGKDGAEDTRGVAAPIFDHTGRAVAGVGTYWQSERYEEERVQFALPFVRALAESLSRYMGYVSAAPAAAL